MLRKFLIFLLILSGSGLTYLLISTYNKNNQNILKKNRIKTYSLSNQLIDRSVSRRKVKMRACFKSYKKSGFISFTMLISSSGSNKITLTQTSGLPKKILSCLYKTLDRILFPSFSGPDIIRNYTIRFDSD